MVLFFLAATILPPSPSHPERSYSTNLPPSPPVTWPAGWQTRGSFVEPPWREPKAARPVLHLPKPALDSFGVAIHTERALRVPPSLALSDRLDPLAESAVAQEGGSPTPAEPGALMDMARISDVFSGSA